MRGLTAGEYFIAGWPQMRHCDFITAVSNSNYNNTNGWLFHMRFVTIFLAGGKCESFQNGVFRVDLQCDKSDSIKCSFVPGIESHFGKGSYNHNQRSGLPTSQGLTAGRVDMSISIDTVMSTNTCSLAWHSSWQYISVVLSEIKAGQVTWPLQPRGAGLWRPPGAHLAPDIMVGNLFSTSSNSILRW